MSEPLEKLLERAKHFADFALHGMGLRPSLFIAPKDSTDILMFIFGSEMKSDDDKDELVAWSRLACIAHGAIASVLMVEAWVIARTPETLNKGEMPSEAFDRQEVVVMFGEKVGGTRHVTFPIIRSGNGKYFGLGESIFDNPVKFSGRFSNILPQIVAPPDLRELAKSALKMKGVTVRAI